MNTREQVKERFRKMLESTPAEGVSAEGLLLQGIAIILNEAKTDGQDVFSDIREFHEKFLQNYNGDPRQLPDDKKWRVSFLKEEVKEFEVAVLKRNIVDQLDALIDICYVAIGTVYLMGIDFNEAWRRVHASNMSKECVKNGEGKYGATVHKGKDYKPPVLEDLCIPNKQFNIPNPLK